MQKPRFPLWGLPLVFLFALLFHIPNSHAALQDKVQEYTLPNGIRLLLVERHGAPTFSAQITLSVGAVDETSRTRGVAHLLEHMLFKGTKTLGTRHYGEEKKLLESIEKAGVELDRLLASKGADPEKIAMARKQLSSLQQEHKKYVVKDEFSSIYSSNGGVGFNAFTSKDLTSYVVSLPSNRLELWARVESDRMKNPVLREFYTEREVVQEERRRSYESSPRGMIYENLLATAYSVHPYRNPIIGWQSDIKNLTLAETREFLQKYYAPVNTVIALVGDLDPKTTLEVVSRYFGDIPPGTPVPPVTAEEPPQKGEKRLHIEFDAEPQLSLAYHKPTLPAREDYIFDLIDLLLSGGRTSRLYRSLVEEKQVATSVSTYGAPGSRYDNLFVISASPRHPHSLEVLEEAIYSELERLAREPISDRELQKLRNRLQTDRYRFLKGNKGLAGMLAYYESVAESWRYVTDYDAVSETITPQEIMETAKRFFTTINRTVVTLSRKGAE